ncbi:hypothetical protein SGL43_05573 [Streptomyces globisporus]|uniref:Uncharacterized protein n=1 Tax=Streptomyces globisporus TaxID=1908 RepID=A0ABN8V991_STRGL|nr:hypothetical protein SGL43_05573 [Streptomyces globisporus]
MTLMAHPVMLRDLIGEYETLATVGADKANSAGASASASASASERRHVQRVRVHRHS